MNTKGVFSHASDNWRTPSTIYDAFMNKGFVDCFPFMSTEDEFKKSYRGGHLYINPPYSQMKQVMNWVIQQANQNNEIWLLIPARTDTQYFRRLISELGHKISIIFITGRLKFNDAKNGAPFPSMFVIISDKITSSQSFTVMNEKEFLEDFEIYY